MSHSISNPTEQPNIPYGYCHCGCGQLAPIATYTIPKRGYFKGLPVRFVHGHNRAKLPTLTGTKVCTRCDLEQGLHRFGAEKRSRDGLKSYCKDCESAKNRSYRIANHDKVLEYDRLRSLQNRAERNAQRLARYYADPNRLVKGRMSARIWRDKNRQHTTQYAAIKYARNRDRIIAAIKASVDRYPDKKRAREVVNNAIKRGDLPRPDSLVCAECQNVQARHYHHYLGYAPEHWLDVVQLCTWCHGKENWIR